VRGITRGLNPSAPTAEEAAAAIAAVEQFLRDTLPPAAPAGPPAREAWLVAALHEGVEREPELRPW
jgi:hypothetical protein